MNKNDKKKSGLSVEINETCKQDHIFKYVYFKDRFYLSDHTYRRMINTLHLDNFFRLSEVIRFRHKLNHFCQIMIVEIDKDCIMLNFQMIMKIRIAFFF